MCVPCLLAAATTIRGRRLFRSRALDCAATIRGRRLYSRMVSIQKNTVCHNTTKVRRVSADTGSSAANGSTLTMVDLAVVGIQD